MTAELAHVQGPAARWRFAGGCLRVALTPGRPRPRGLAVASVVAGAVILFSLTTGPPPSKTPGWTATNLIASLTVYGWYLAGAIATEARPATLGPPDRPGRSPTIRSVIVVGMMAAAALDAFVLLRFPELRSQGNAGPAGYVATAVVTVALLAIFATYAWLAVTRTRTRSPGAVVARQYGLVAGCLIGPLLVAASYVPAPTAVIVAAAGACSMAAGHLASRAGGSARAGLAAGVWAGIVAGLILLVVGAGLILLTGGPSHSPTMIADFHASKFHDLRSFSVARTFGLDGDPPLVGALVPLVFVPLIFAGLAAFGATRGERRIPRRHPQPPPA